MDVVTCVITIVCVITGKEKEKEEEEGQKSWSHYWLETKWTEQWTTEIYDVTYNEESYIKLRM